MSFTSLGFRRSMGVFVLAVGWTVSASAQINLSDIVAGGDGTGTGFPSLAENPDPTGQAANTGEYPFAAVHLDNGTFMTRIEADAFHNGTTEANDPLEDANPSPVSGASFTDPLADVEAAPLIDSVFFLPTLDVPLNLENVQFPYLQGDEWGNSWNHVLSNRTHDIDKGREDCFAGGSANWETCLGIHASAGITFDLEAIRAEHGAENVVSFSTFIGADRCGALINFYVIFSDEEDIIDDPNGNTFIDENGNNQQDPGEIRYWVENSNPNSAAQYIAEIPEGALYLTLTVGAGGNGIGCDHGVLANPQILSFVPPVPVEDLSCARNEDGDFAISWTNLNENPPPDPIQILANGEEVGTVPNNAESFVLDRDLAPLGDFQLCIENGSPFPACCNPASTDQDGRIKNWLVTGPYLNPFGCNGINDDLLGNHIAPSKIGCLYPEAGDSVDYEPDLSVSTGYGGPVDGDGKPVWRVLDDGFSQGNQDLQAEAVANGWPNDDVMAWGVTYFTYNGAAPIEVDLCLGSDDGIQVWLDENLVWNNNACRGIGLCQDTALGFDFGAIEPGPHRLAVGAWERGGGWGLNAALMVGGLPVLDGDPDWTFHGANKPAGLAPSANCGDSECIELSLDPGQSLLGVGRSVALTATCRDAAGLPSIVTDQVEFSVDPDGVVSVVDGVVTGEGTGDATVTATLGDLSAEMTVRVANLLSLSDMAAGGDGSGTGFPNTAPDPLDPALNTGEYPFGGINLDTGAFMTFQELMGFNAGTADADGINPSPVEASDFVDSVFFLSDDFVQITTEGVVVLWDPGDINAAGSYNHVLSNTTHRIDQNDFSISAGGREEWTSAVGIHAAAGISYDLSAIRAEHGDDAVGDLSVFLGKDECDGNLSLMVIYSDADGVIEDDLATELNPPPVGDPFPFVRVIADLLPDGVQYLGEIPAEATHLTLAVGANGDGIGCDHGVFADAVIIGGETAPGGFKRGDTDASGLVDISDPIFNLQVQFVGGGLAFRCRDAADVDDSGVIDISDPIYNLQYQFVGGIAPPPAPGPATCGSDPTADGLECADYPQEKC